MIYFISGHRNITENEFKEHYIPKLKYAIENNGEFVVGDYYGVDYMAQMYLKGKVDDSRVTVYHMSENPSKYIEGFKLKGGYLIDEERDAAMTEESDIDIAWSRTITSGTQRNLTRRIENDHIKALEYICSQLDNDILNPILSKYNTEKKSITKVRQELFHK